MSWNRCGVEDPYKSKSYVPVLRQFCTAVLGQTSHSDAEGFLKRATTVVGWAMESNDMGSYKADRKRPRAAYVLYSGPDGVITSSISHPKAHVEHPYTQKRTRDLLLVGYNLAQVAILTGRLSFAQCVGALMAIVDARRGAVLMPVQYQASFTSSATPGDGFVARYGNCTVTDRNGTFVNLQQEDIRVNGEVQNALQYLQVGSGNAVWPWSGASTSSVVAALSKPCGTIAPTKTSNAATTLPAGTPSVTENDLRAAMVTMQINPDTPSNPAADPDNGFSFKRVGGSRVILSGVKFNGAGGYSTGWFATLPGKPKIRHLTMAQFQDHVSTVVQDIRNGLY